MRPDARSAGAEEYRAWYGLARWKKRRAEQLRREPLCRMCLPRTTPGTVADHVEDHKGDPEKFWHGALQTLCKTHHDATKQGDTFWGFSAGVGPDGWPTDPRHTANGGDGRMSKEVIERRLPSDLKPSAIPLAIVCGPPGSGKSTHVRAHARPGDIVIDLDAIMQQLSGLPEHQTSAKFLSRALARRNAQLRALATTARGPSAWFIVAAPSEEERALWQRRLGGRLVVLATPLDECVRRIKADPARKGEHDRMIRAAEQWWSANGSQRHARAIP